MERGLRHLVTAPVPCAGAALILATGLGAADGSACPTPAVTAPLAEQRAAMVCLVNDRREERGLRELRRSVRLDRAARLKASAIARCEDFSHTPCGRTFASTFIVAGYAVGSWTVGENLAWGAGERGRGRAHLRPAARLPDAPPELRAPGLAGHRRGGLAGSALRSR